VTIGDAIVVFAPAAIVLTWVRIALMVRPVGTPKLPDPAKLGMPMAGNASPQAAHAALSRGGGAARPKFRT
jgi:hypothetical protein